MRKKSFRIIEVAIFLFIFLLLFSKVSLLIKTYGKDTIDTRMSCLFYELPKDTVDVIILGDSHSFMSYNNHLIFEKTGITSATLSSSGNSILNCYWELKEAFSRQKKTKMVVLDVQPIRNTITNDNFNDNTLSISSSFTTLPDLSLNKWLCYFDIKNRKYGGSDKINIYDCLSFLTYREDMDRRLSITQFKNLLFTPYKEFKTLGYFPLYSGRITPIIEDIEETKEIILLDNTVELEYLVKINQLCNDNNCILVLTNTPSIIDNKTDGTVTEQVQQWSINNGVDFIDYNSMIKELEIDLTTDFMDEGHLNFWGAQKLTSFFSDYLINKKIFTSHKGDNKYKMWDVSYDYSTFNDDLLKSAN